MMERISLFNELKKGGYDSCIITTFNAYFPFYEDVLLKRLRNSGIRQNVVIMDSKQCQVAMDQSYPQFSGRHYTLAPMDCKAAFHPKIVMLLGKKKGLLAIGSHNLTFSGYGVNAEISNVIRFRIGHEEDTLPLFSQAWLAIQTWVKDYGDALSEPVKKSINSSIEGIDWLIPSDSDDEADVQFFFSSSSTESLWIQVEPWVPANPNCCSILGAFFDKKLNFIDVFNQDVQPDELLIGIQPSTVDVPGNILKRNELQVVNSECMLVDSKINNNTYIHAKSIFVEDKHQPVLISGSANPSAPAWLLKGDRCNAEAVLVRLDEKVTEASTTLGFDKLKKSETIVEIDNPTASPDKSILGSTIHLIIATIRSGQLCFSCSLELQNSSLWLESTGGEVLKKIYIKNQEDNICITLQGNILSNLMTASLRKGNKILAKFLLFFADEVEAITAKGMKRKFRDALGTLSTDTPELKLLFNYLDKIIFDNKDSSQLKKARINSIKNNNGLAEADSQSLVVEWNGIPGTLKSKPKRLNVNDDLTNLLDAFVYGLGYDAIETSAFSGEDKFGRNEEEIIGSDDEDPVDEQSESNQKDELSNGEKLDICHRRLRKISRKINTGLDSLKKGDITHVQLLPNLLAVLSLFKELNQRSEDFSWVDEEYSILPYDAIILLFNKICECWWGSSYGLLQKQDDNDGFLSDIDELVRLRGLLIWLAWYVEISYQPKPGFAEKFDVRDQRLWGNAVYILLAQLVTSDEMIEEEASKICSTESDFCLNWFVELVRFGKKLNIIYDKAKKTRKTLPEPSEAGWVLHRNNAFKGLRYCNEVNDGRVRFACVSHVGEYRRFMAEKMTIAVFN